MPKQNIADGIFAQYIISCSNTELILRILDFSVKCSSWFCIIACGKLHETLRSHMDHLCIFIADNTDDHAISSIEITADTSSVYAKKVRIILYRTKCDLKKVI